MWLEVCFGLMTGQKFPPDEPPNVVVAKQLQRIAMNPKPYPSARRELRQSEAAQWRRDDYVRGHVPPRSGLPLWAKAALLVVWALIVANGIGAVLGLFWRHQ